MPELQFETIIPISCTDAFNVAVGIEHYRNLTDELKEAAVLERKENSMVARFSFNPEGTMAPIARRLGFSDKDQVALIEWQNAGKGKIITARNISGPLKHIFMQCRLLPLNDNQTKANLHVDFESGKGFLADAGAKLAAQASSILFIPRIVSAIVAEVKSRDTKQPAPG